MIGLYLMTQKGFTVLKEVVEKGYAPSISFVCAARDPAITQDYYEDIKKICLSYGIPFFDRKEFVDSHSEYCIAISWRWLIHTKATLLVLHDSLLPKYRGFAPLVTALINGDSQVGVTVLRASAEYDRGAVAMQCSLSVTYPKKIGALIAEISTVYAKMVSTLFEYILNNQTLFFTAQDESRATYSLWRNEEDYRIEWSMDAERIQRSVDALGEPYKGASCMVEGQQARIYSARVVEDVFIENRRPGKVIFMREGKPVIVCGSGLLEITEMRWEHGENALPLKNFRVQLT